MLPFLIYPALTPLIWPRLGRLLREKTMMIMIPLNLMKIQPSILISTLK